MREKKATQKGHIKKKNKHSIERTNMQSEIKGQSSWILLSPRTSSETNFKKKMSDSLFSPQSQQRVWVGVSPPQGVDVVWHIHHCTNFQFVRSLPIFSTMF